LLLLSRWQGEKPIPHDEAQGVATVATISRDEASSESLTDSAKVNSSHARNTIAGGISISVGKTSA
jgi:hypothetical protein